MIILGLTGSIGMGKSTAAEQFKKHNIPVLDADKVVHDLYKGAAAPEIEKAFPGSVKDGEVDRTVLAGYLMETPSDFKKLEAIIHPMVRKEEIDFLLECEKNGEEIVVLEIPLLLEGNMDDDVDAVIVVSAADEIRRERVMQRPGMTKEKLEAIIAKQLPDEIKRDRADYIVDTSRDIKDTWDQVDNIIEGMKAYVAQTIEPMALDRWKEKYSDLMS